ncbi:hypothetical protein ZIOFF_034472 [Zingiber officinale]|uniref:Protein ENHANCED DISEASE RESISTANCE 2 C-terminal domain-containing protein n=1 Tax=Zingiber officinale TaxID=94328 RepID=A0A8J5GJI4_ZINOF|nr:hypothetical protein ZIOFF_034472 [Zingiber officinale]
MNDVLRLKHEQVENACEIMDSLQAMFGQQSSHSKHKAIKKAMNAKMKKGQTSIAFKLLMRSFFVDKAIAVTLFGAKRGRINLAIPPVATLLPHRAASAHVRAPPEDSVEIVGPWIVRTAVGEQAICILGRAVSCKYTSGLNYIEVDVDIGSSIIANAIVHLAFGYVTILTVDLAFLIESQTEEELPEQILGAVRFSNLNPASAGHYDLTSDADAGSHPPLLPTRLWRSIGFGFTNLPLQGSLEPSSIMSDHTNGNLHGENDTKKNDETW